MHIRIFLFITCWTVLMGCQNQHVYDEKIAEVAQVESHALTLQNGRQVDMIGIYIPDTSEVNYMKDLQDYLTQLLQGKQVKVRTIEHKINSAEFAPLNDLVEIFMDDLNVNKYLLENGKAFYNKIYASKKMDLEYRNLEKTARDANRGLWENKERLKVVLVRHENWKLLYHPECADLSTFKSAEIVYYYFVPQARVGGILLDGFNDCNRARFF